MARRKRPVKARSSGSRKRKTAAGASSRKVADALACLRRQLADSQRELAGARQQQAATSDVLRLMSSSPADIQPVFDAIAESASRLCAAYDVVIRRVDGDVMRLAAHVGPIPITLDAPAITPRTIAGRAILERRTMHFHDVLEPHLRVEYPDSHLMREPGSFRTVLVAPLLREDTAIGIISIRRPEVNPFSENEVKLLETFASQAVIAIENVRLFNETKEALEQQTVISEILRVISSSPTDVQPVFDAIVKSGVHLFGGMNVTLRLVQGDHSELVAASHRIDGDRPIALDDESTPGSRAIRRREVVQVPDALAQELAGTLVRQRAEQRGFRAILAAPMLRENNAIGAINVLRAAPGPFTNKEVALLETFASQAVIAIENVRLFKELQGRNAEITEALEQQTATAEILKVISSSPTDVRPVFDAVVESAARLCGANDVLIRRVEGGEARAVAHLGPMPIGREGTPITMGSFAGRAILERRPIHIEDVRDPRVHEEYPHSSMNRGLAQHFRTILIAPLLRGDIAIGAIIMRREEARPFTDKEIALLKTFADQAVIAIENVRLFKELQARNAEVTEALEQQTATADILKVISSSPTDTQPVFDAILESATRLCDAHSAALRLYVGGQFRPLSVAQRGISPEYAARIADEQRKYALHPEGGIARMLADRQPMHILDRRESPSYRDGHPPTVALVDLGGVRTFLAVPMLKEGRVMGAIVVHRREVRAFTQKQIDLLSTFADQAVIAIENVRLFKELQARNAEVTESLEQQTATANILEVISSSPTDTQPVFDAIVKSAVQLFGGLDVTLRLVKGERSEIVASTRPLSAGIFPVPISDDSFPSSRTMLRREVLHLPNVLEADWINPEFRQRAEQRGLGSIAIAPMVRDDTAIGVINVNRAVTGPFTDKQIALLQTFANQAVIAIENVRLFKELQTRNAEVTESLERQTATADILQVISGSPTDTQPVFDSILRSATRLCEAYRGALHLYDGEAFTLMAEQGASTAFAHFREKGVLRPSLLSGLGQMAASKRVVHIANLAETPGYAARDPLVVASVELDGTRTYLAVPMLKEGSLIGAITFRRQEVRPFSDQQIALLQTFADQAVIAIENVRLFKELEARNAEVTESLEQQTATAEILSVISRSPTDVTPVLDMVAHRAAQLCEAPDARIFVVDGEDLRYVAGFGEVTFSLDAYKLRLTRGLIIGRAIIDRRILHIEDARTLPEGEYAEALELQRRFGYRTILAVPLVREDKAFGVIMLRRNEVRPFSAKQVDLVKTFADQAVIAIENVRLFRETNEALERQTATADILRVISSSPTDIQPVLDAVASTAARLCGASDALIRRVDGDVLRLVAHYGAIPAATEVRVLNRDSVMGRAVLDRQTFHVHDVVAADELPISTDLARLHGFRTVVSTPLLREGQPIGAIAIRRVEVRPFSDSEIKLLETFADQAVIAIENVRLFKELEARNAEVTESLEQQTATAEILSVISSSPTDVMPVLEAVTHRAAQLCDAPDARLYLVEADSLRYVVGFGDLTGARPILSLTRGLVIGRAIIDSAVVHIADLAAALDEFTEARVPQQLFGHRTTLAVPLLREGKAFGGILMRRKEVRPFTEKQVELVKTFADQAVIAIENVRLFNEIQDKSSQLEVASKHKSEFLAHMSHELRTPLNAIIGFSEVLVERMFGEVNAKQDEYLRDIHSSGQHLLSLINDILDLSKVEAGRMELELSVFHLPSALQNALTLVRERAQAHGIALELRVDENLGEISADERKVKQIVLNLLSNAVKFTPDGGRVEVDAHMNDKAVEVSVTDTGVGIAPGDQEAVFEEFRQVGRKYTSKQEGTGLGLALTRRFVELHGGKIWLESAPGKGSTFTFSLPLTAEMQPPMNADKIKTN